MPATLDTIEGILKDYYIGPLQEQLNNEIMCLQMFEKATVSWSGRQALIPVHISRNDGVNYGVESFTGPPGNLPPAGDQGTVQLSVTASYLYGSFAITGQAIASAAKGGAGAFVGSLEMEMDKLKDDVRNRADQACVSGGLVVGFCNDKDYANPGAAVSTQFRGDFLKIGRLLATHGAVPVECTQLSNGTLTGDANSYTVISPGGVTITAIDPVAGTIELDSGAPFTFNAVPGGYGIGIQIELGTGWTGDVDVQSEATGMYSNLGSTGHFGVPRDGDPFGNPAAVPPVAPSPTSRLQSIVFTGDVGVAGGINHGQAVDVTLNRMQDVLDDLNDLSGADPDVILVHPSMRSKYMGLLTGSFSATGVINSSGEKATAGDGGFLGLSYGGIKIKTSRHVGRGLALFLTTKTWKMAVLDSGKFADLDGSVLDRVPGNDAWGGFYKWYYDHYCFRPNANAVLCGLLAGAWT